MACQHDPFPVHDKSRHDSAYGSFFTQDMFPSKMQYEVYIDITYMTGQECYFIVQCLLARNDISLKKMYLFKNYYECCLLWYINTQCCFS